MPQTSMTSTRIAILGGGLSGLMAARALHRQGIHDFVLLEARSALGGRITSFQSPAAYTPTTAALHRFDLGPSWYWPDFQPDLHALIEGLGLATFVQFDEGNMVIEQSAQSAPMRVPGYAQSPASMRLLGGTEALVDALKAEVPPHHIRTGHTVRSLRADGAQVHLTSADALGQHHHWQTEHVLLALPPAPGRGTVGLAAAIARRFAQCVATHAHLDGAPRQIRRCVRNTLLARAGSVRPSPQRTRTPGRNPRPVAARRGRRSIWFCGCACRCSSHRI